MTRRTAAVLLVVIAVLGGLIYFLNVNPQVANNPTPTGAAAVPGATPTYVWNIDPTGVNGITVTDLTKNIVFNATEDSAGVWIVNKPQSGPADQTLMNTYVSTAVTLTTTQSLNDITNLGDFGLDHPLFSIDLKQTNGTTSTIVIGKKSPTGEAYYVLPQGAVHPILVTASALDTLLGLPAAPPIATPTPAVSETPIPTLPLPLPSPTP